MHGNMMKRKANILQQRRGIQTLYLKTKTTLILETNFMGASRVTDGLHLKNTQDV